MAKLPKKKNKKKEKCKAYRKKNLKKSTTAEDAGHF